MFAVFVAHNISNNMNQSTLDQILRSMDERERLEQLEQRRLATLNAEERENERMLEGDVLQFLDLEAIESEGEESDQTAEDGFDEAVDDLLPRDSRCCASVFVRPHWNRIFQTRSLEFDDLNEREQRRVVSRTRQWACVVASQSRKSKL